MRHIVTTDATRLDGKNKGQIVSWLGPTMGHGAVPVEAHE